MKESISNIACIILLISLINLFISLIAYWFIPEKYLDIASKLLWVISAAIGWYILDKGIIRINNL